MPSLERTISSVPWPKAGATVRMARTRYWKKTAMSASEESRSYQTEARSVDERNSAAAVVLPHPGPAQMNDALRSRFDVRRLIRCSRLMRLALRTGGRSFDSMNLIIPPVRR